MKRKIMIIVVLIFSFCKNVFAETYYGDYRKVEDIGNYSEDTVKIDSYKLYNTYETKYIDMGYMLENNDYIKDEKDFKEEYVEVSNSEELSDEYIKVIPNKEKTGELTIKNIPEDMKIYEIELYLNNQKIAFGFLDNDRTGLSNLNDKNYETYLDGSIRDSFILNLYVTLNLKNFILIIYTDSENDYNITLDFFKEPYDITLHSNKNKHVVVFDKLEENTVDRVNYEYKGLRTLYRYYKEEKIPLNNYVQYGENILLDDYKEITNFYVRDKLVLKDDNIITSKDTRINDFIEYSTSDVNINCNIDYDLNGIYECEFVSNDIFVYKDIIVDIPNSIINETNIINIELQDNNKDIEIANNIEKVYINEDKENKKKNIKLDNKTKIIEDIRSKEIITNKQKIIGSDKSKVNVNNIKEKIILNMVKYIIIANLIIIEIILFIRKKKKR